LIESYLALSYVLLYPIVTVL